MIAIENLKKSYDGFDLEISLEVPAGCVTGLIGRNGAGKSTTIKSILGLVRPDSGSVRVLGKDATEITPEDKALIGVALSDSGFSQYLNLEDIIQILKNTYKTFQESAFRSECQKQKLPLKKPVKEFSTGMKAKLRVLIAMCHTASLLILDEPTSGLDVIARNEILDMLRAWLAENPERSILISSHISSDLEGLCDDIYMINDGRVILHEDTDRVLSNYAVLKVSDEVYEKLDKQYIKASKKESFGYSCLTSEKQFYRENYPDIVIENNNIDSMIVLMLGGH